MKLKAGELERHLDGLAAGRAGMLIFGPDAIAVGQIRDRIALAVTGPEGEAEMRLTRLDAAALRSDPAALQDAMRAQGFFPGPRAVLLDGAGDGLAGLIAGALDGARPGEDGFLIVCAGVLAARSRLRKLFEAGANLVALQLFDDPPGPRQIAAMLAEAGLPAADQDALQALAAFAAEIDTGSLARLIDKIALYRADRPGPLRLSDVLDCAPQNLEAGLDEAVAAAAEGRIDALARQLSRLKAQGVAPTSICIAAARHFRILHAAACDPAGAEAALGR
ncbi:MAG: DNA polymerase III subunit delta, partial [Alphaproteobacteria bacterium]